MNSIIYYILIFIIGTLFGSFYTLAIYRIPKRQDITHKPSYCPNCNHKLGFLDLIPILSYIGLRGKCRYCKEKIRPRYLILEVLSGIIFVVLAILMQLNFENIKMWRIAEYSFMILFITFLILIAGIDQENYKIDKMVTIYGLVISIMYIVYLYIIEKASIYRYIIYLVFYIIVWLLDTITLKKFAKDSYVTGLLITIITMAIFTGEFITINSIIYTLLIIFIDTLVEKIQKRKKRNIKVEVKVQPKISIGFYLAISNIIMLMLFLFFANYKI